jgi:4-hydroxybenzoate polyprenyltransferase
MLLNDCIRLLRPHQWLKNGFVFLPAFFSGNMLNPAVALTCGVVATAFSLAASGVYCVNDACDAAADSQHPLKRARPVAAGRISKGAACIIAAICALLSITLIICVKVENRTSVSTLIATYLALNLAYCLFLKSYAIVDVVVIAVGFVLRIFAGGMACSIRLSEWIVIMTFLLALFLAFAKRRDDVNILLSEGVKSRKNVYRYNKEFLNQAITVVSSVTVVAYIMYTLSEDVIERFGSRNVYLTAVFVLTGIIRYMQLTLVDQKSGSPTVVLLKDRFIQLCIVGWALMFFIIIYL